MIKLFSSKYYKQQLSGAGNDLLIYIAGEFIRIQKLNIDTNTAVQIVSDGKTLERGVVVVSEKWELEMI